MNRFLAGQDPYKQMDSHHNMLEENEFKSLEGSKEDSLEKLSSSEEGASSHERFAYKYVLKKTLTKYERNHNTIQTGN